MSNVPVHLLCPVCGHRWHAATIDPDAWWGKDSTPEKVAARCYCPRCDHHPPMTIDVELPLFAGETPGAGR